MKRTGLDVYEQSRYSYLCKNAGDFFLCLEIIIPFYTVVLDQPGPAYYRVSSQTVIVYK